MPAGDGVRAPSALTEYLETVPLVDHHVHGALVEAPTRARFEQCLNEGSPLPVPDWMSQFDSQLGFAIRRWCAPLLDLEPGAPADAYWARRESLGEAEVRHRLLTAAGVSDWVVDTGFASGDVLGYAEMAAETGARGHEIVRLEPLAEELAGSGVAGADYAEAFRALVAERTVSAVGMKSILAYRTGFDVDLDRPTEAQVAEAATRWLAGTDPAHPRLADPVLLRFGMYCCVDRGLPLQLHVGFGDRDLDLRRVDPLLLRPFLFEAERAGVPVLLLHCYPFEREAGYLAQAFTNVYLDVGLGINYVGARSAALIASSLELAPFAKVLYSSDAWGPPELHHLGARLWRNGMASVLGAWVDAGEWTEADAVRVAGMMAGGNARRVYGV